MDFGAIFRALANFGSLEIWLYMAIGIVLGLIFGVIPGISGMLAIALLLPFIYTMVPLKAFIMMMTILATQYLGGAVSAILLNIPGTAGNSATVLDGFPMTQRGEGGRAIGAAQAAGALAHLITAIVSLFMVPVIIPLIITLRSADMVFVIVLGIVFIGALSGGSMVKGLMSGGLGLMVALIGFQASTAAARFTFGSLYLYDGIPLIPVMLGLFAIPEMVSLATTGGAIAKTQVVIKGWSDVWRGVKDVFRCKALVLRTQLIGFIVGIAPGAGATPAAFISYAHAKQTSKSPETFGKGNVEGVIAPESGNNACEAGDLLTTLALGIPGSPPMALLLGAITMLGLAPGPEMLTKHLDLSLTLLWAIGIAAVFGAIICLIAAPHLSKVAFIPGRVLVPLVLVLAFTGSFAYHKSIEDVLVMVIFGALGFLMKRFEFNRAGLLLGFVLGSIFEKYLFLALKTGGPFFFVRPISLGLIFFTIFVMAFGPVKELVQRRRKVSRA
ncbi:MAG: tripartite tricarboxylate transporter permease [Chloroflexota bacterium]